MAETRNWRLGETTSKQLENFVEQMLKSASTMELAGKAQTVANEVIITHLMFEQYFIRNSSYACVSIEWVRTAEQTTISAISAGGSQGLLNIDWGSSGNMLDKVERVLKRL